MDGLVDGDVAGAPGTARFELAVSDDFADSTTTAWLDATAEGDYYREDRRRRAERGAPATSTGSSTAPPPTTPGSAPPARFRTLPGAEAAEEVSFVVVTGMNYALFHGGPPAVRLARGRRPLGYPGLASILGQGAGVLRRHRRQRLLRRPFSEFERTPVVPCARSGTSSSVQPRFIDLFASVSHLLGEGRPRLPLQRLGQHRRARARPVARAGRRAHVSSSRCRWSTRTTPDPRTYRTHSASRARPGRVWS